MTGFAAPPLVGAVTSRWRQSSEVFAAGLPVPSSCGHEAPARVASRVPAHGRAPAGGAHRSSPVGGAA